jgi:hypothetical protein
MRFFHMLHGSLPVGPEGPTTGGDGMKEMFEQWQKNMGKMCEPLQKMMTDLDWQKGAGAAVPINWSSWLSALRSSLDVNTSWWRMFMDQTEEVFYKTYKECPFYNASAEEQMRQFGANLRKAHNLQQESFKEYLDKMEALLREKE